MVVDQLHQQFITELDLAVDDLVAQEEADSIMEGTPAHGVAATGVGAIDPTLLIKYLPVVLDALSTLIKKLQSA